MEAGPDGYYAGVNIGGMSFDMFNNGVSNSDLYFSNYKQVKQAGDNTEPCQIYTSTFASDHFSGSCTSWSTHEEESPEYACLQSTVKDRSLVEGNEGDSEADLYGLVSDILEEPDKTESIFPEGTAASSLKSIWSSNLKREVYQQMFHSDHNKNSLPGSYLQPSVCPDVYNRSRRQYFSDESAAAQLKAEELYQRFGAFDVNDYWLCPNGNSSYYPFKDLEMSAVQSADASYADSVFTPPQIKPLPAAMRGLQGSSMANYAIEGLFDCADAQPVDSTEAIAGGFMPPKLNNAYCAPYPDFYQYNRINDNFMQFPVQEGKPITSNLPPVLHMQLDSNKGFQEKQELSKQYEEHLSDQQSLKYVRATAADIQKKLFKKEIMLSGDFNVRNIPDCQIKAPHLVGDYGKKPLAALGAQHADHLKAPTSASCSVYSDSLFQNATAWSNVPKSSLYQTAGKQFEGSHPEGGHGQASSMSKMMAHPVSEFAAPGQQTGRSSLYFSESASDDSSRFYCPEFVYKSPHQNPPKVVEAKSKATEGNEYEISADKRSKPESLVCEALCAPHFGPSDINEKQNRQKKNASNSKKVRDLLQHPYLELCHGSKRQAGGGGSIPAQAKLLCPRYAGTSGNPRSSNSLPTTSGLPVDLFELLPSDELHPLHPYFTDLFCGDVPLALPPSVQIPRLLKSRSAGPANELHTQLEECYEQWRLLEKERKKAEIILAKIHPGKRIASGNSNSTPRLPPNPSRVDHLIVDQLRGHAKILNLLGKMEHLRCFSLHSKIYIALDQYLKSIYITQARRKDEIINISSRQCQVASRYQEDRDILILAAAVKEMSLATRKARTVLWCALQMTLPKGAAAAGEGQEDPPRMLPEESVDYKSAQHEGSQSV
ncbi:meiosis-specific coiled-coil domain-containing protein MEIOC-like isoform X1 [Polypterus senegalus]|uniref:meiosis-specific coiled-coil domain-containing protein MEIOC-like isoform X1 n=1 Tax=Polypterus senegalus TaxID=55291 RepID=UPI001962477D|nr:meiosis-specific coiled-coil domain-containing protein MEIOC-like isoform X1 [Polypterus senegalus]